MLACLRQQLPGLYAQFLAFDHCDTVAAAAAHLLSHAPEHFALLGFSLGGIVAMHAAAAAPGRVRGLALLGTTTLPVPASQHGDRRAQAAQAHGIGLRSFLEQHLWPKYVASRLQSDIALQDDLYAMAAAVGTDALQRQTELALNRPDARPLLPSLGMPTLVLAGEEDQVCPPEGQHALAAALPDATLAMVPEAGHFAPLEKPDVVAAHVAAWFNTLARS